MVVTALLFFVSKVVNCVHWYSFTVGALTAKHIPLLQLATGEAREQLRTSIERSKEACGQVYAKTDWGKQVPLQIG